MSESSEHVIRVRAVTEVPQAEEVRTLIARCVNTVLAQEEIDFHTFIDVTITDDEGIRSLNREFRNKDEVTDVLSFPMYEFVNGKACEKMSGQESPEDGTIMLGDMVLNYRRACQQAEEYGHSAARECGFLTVHSVLHMLGYDHERGEEDCRLMREREELALRKVGLTREQ